MILPSSPRRAVAMVSTFGTYAILRAAEEIMVRGAEAAVHVALERVGAMIGLTW